MTTEQLVQWMDGELAAADARAVTVHVNACADCRTLADALRNASTALAESARAIPVPASLQRRARPASSTPTSRAWRPRRATIVAGLLAACALVVVAQPVRRRIASLFAGEPARVDSVATPREAPTHAGETVLGVTPRGTTFVVELASARPDDSLRLRTTTARDVTVRVPAGAAVWSMADGVRLAHASGGAVTYVLEMAPGVTEVRLRRSTGSETVIRRADVDGRGVVTLAVGMP